MAIHIVSATRATEAAFWEAQPLGRSLTRLKFDIEIVPCVTFENHDGLPVVYNRAIDAATDDDILVFVHDDVWLDDYYLNFRLRDALNHMHVVGVAGNRVRVPGQPAWAASGPGFVRDDSSISGFVAHGDGPFGDILAFGPLPVACELMDGVFLAARAQTLKAHGLRFDPQFDFHFYDLDFCRRARQLGLTLGTWAIALTHQSHGAFGDDAWRANGMRYFQKWGD